jgi:adenylosuccinate lyase
MADLKPRGTSASRLDYGARYSRPEMTAIWSAENRYRIWWQIEVFAAEAMGSIG